MQVFDAIPKQWGNSIGITIPRDVIEREHITTKKKVKFFVVGDMNEIKKTFGSLKIRKPAQQIADEIDEGYD